MISGTAYDQLKKNVEAGFQYLGEQRFKNIAEPVRVYRVLMDPKDAGRRTRSAKTAWWKWSTLAAGIISICLITGAVWLLWRNEPERSIAVLPFKNLSKDAAQDYLADGITEDLTTDLARIPGLFVTSRNAAFSATCPPAAPSHWQDRPPRLRLRQRRRPQNPSIPAPRDAGGGAGVRRGAAAAGCPRVAAAPPASRAFSPEPRRPPTAPELRSVCRRAGQRLPPRRRRPSKRRGPSLTRQAPRRGQARPGSRPAQSPGRSP